MKRKLMGLLCVCILLSGCRIGSTQTVPTEPNVTEISTTQPTVSHLPLLEQGTILEESSNLRYIPNETVEGMRNPAMRLLGNGLLLSEYTDQGLVLNHISLEDGTLLASGSVAAGPETRLYIGSGEIGLCDREYGLISILDEQFRMLRTYHVTTEGDDWYLNQELDTLYIFFYDRGLLARNLETGAENWLISNGFRVTSLAAEGSYLILNYTDRENQKTYTRCLNLSTATLETLPIDGSVSGGVRMGETWMLQRDVEQVLVQGGSASSCSTRDAVIRLLSPRKHLLMLDSSRRNLTLYDTSGTFLSYCSLPQNSHAFTGEDFVWSGYWEGYFFTDFIGSSSRLMFWDVRTDTDGEALQLVPLDTVQAPEPVLEQQLYQKATELSQRFGVEIRIAEQCALDYTHYDTYALTDPLFVRSSLDILENALSQYPEGFFNQLCFGSIGSIRIEVVGSLMIKDGVENRRDSAGGFAQNMGSYYLIALNGFLLAEQTVYHEFSHIIDKRLEWDSLIRTDALYSEEAWMSLQPEGFRYAMSYVDALESPTDLNYFVSDYSTTYPTEDRADLMEAAMSDDSWAFEAGSGCRAKMQFYADCIRDCFDTTGWPEITAWEQLLYP